MLQKRMVINECYILQARLGEDSCSEHWTATAIFSATRFLLRFIKNSADTAENSDCLSALRAEALRCYRVRGPSIADFVEVEFFRNQLFISSEYHGETSLLSVLSKKTDWCLEQICGASVSMLVGLESFHGQGVLYGGLNAENVQLEKIGASDYSFKIRKPCFLPLLPVLGGNAQARAENWAYIAPEYKERKFLYEGSDVYSVGIHLVRFFTGTFPFPDVPQSLEAGSASLRYATNALLRRLVPEPLIRIILRALMADPARRYNSCLDMRRDLRLFMEGADLATRDASTYFAPSDTDGRGGKDGGGVLYPVHVFEDQEKIDRIEKQELIPLAEEGQWSIDDYIENGRSALGGEQGIRPAVPVRPVEQAKKEAGDEFFSPRTPEAPDDRTAARAGSLASPSGFLSINQVQVGTDASDKSQTWNYQRVQVQDVRAIIDLSVNRARKGKGSFRYIQELPALSGELFASMEILKSTCLYVNLGSCSRSGRTTSLQFLKTLRQGLYRELSGETRKSLGLRASLAAERDSFGALKGPPLGSLLYGSDGGEVPSAALSGTACQESLVQTLRTFGKKKKPLVLVVRGGEGISFDLHRIFSSMAALIRDSPVCVFVFFEHAQFASWHALKAVPPQYIPRTTR